MANTLTIQLRPTKKYSPPSIANLFHNTGLSKATYWIKEGNNIISNLDLKNLTTCKAVSLWREWEEQATQLVIKNKGKNPQKKQVLIEEGLMVIGKDVKVENNQDLINIFEEFKKWFENKYNTKILAYFYHNHEGHIDPENEGNFVANRHIHFFFRNIDENGNSVRRQIKKSDLSEFQTIIHQIGKKYIPDLERATNYKKLGLKAPRHQSHREYRTQKIKQELIPKLVEKAKENKKLKEKIAKVKDLKEYNKRLRELLKQLGAKREDYAYLEEHIRKLKEFIKQKILTEKKLRKEIEELEKQLRKMIEERDKYFYELEKEKTKFEFLNKKIKVYRCSFYITHKSNNSNFEELLQQQRLKEFLEKEKKQQRIKDYKKIDEQTTLIETPYSEIIDTPDKIEITTVQIEGENERIKRTNLEIEIVFMIDLALAKGWKLETIRAEGDEEFVRLVNKEIQRRLNNPYDFKNSFRPSL